MKENHAIGIVCILVFLSRLPFLSHGFGHEEDSWGLAVNALGMHERGDYEASRLPGHPLQEYVYAFLVPWISPVLFNLLSALFSVMGVFYFARIMQHLKLEKPWLGALVLGMVPVYFASSTYTIDYVWSLALTLASGYYFLKNKWWLAGLLLGASVACRLSAAASLLCFVPLLTTPLLSRESFRAFFLTLLFSLPVILLFYAPALHRYGWGFLTFTDQFPYPNLPKFLYKAGPGVWGLLGLLALAIFSIPAILSPTSKKNITLALLIACLLWGIAYLRLPLKSGYLIPLLPFVVLFFFERLHGKKLAIFSLMMCLSPWIFGINLTDPFRGSESSGLEWRFKAGGQEIFLDPIYGPVFNERSKRIQKENYTRKIEGLFLNEFPEQPPVILAGWWYNELKFRQHFNPNFNAILEFYISEQKLKAYKDTGNTIYALPEQIHYNDLYSGIQTTASYAIPLEVK